MITGIVVIYIYISYVATVSEISNIPQNDIGNSSGPYSRVSDLRLRVEATVRLAV